MDPEEPKLGASAFDVLVVHSDNLELGGFSR